MTTTTWLVDDTKIDLVYRGPRTGITVRTGDAVMTIPAKTLGAWPLAVPGRHVRVEVRRNLDVPCFFVFSDDHPVPRGVTTRRDAAAGTTCAAHSSPAVCRCARCDAPSCTTCSPDGHRCGACAWALHEAEHARIRRIRTWAVVGTLSAFAGILAIGLVLRWKPCAELGAGGIGLVSWLFIRGWRAERRERRMGLGSALDPQLGAQPEARAVTRAR